MLKLNCAGSLTGIVGPDGMKRKCLACGAEKDTSIKEVYPYPDDDIIDDQPICPLMDIDCEGSGAWQGTAGGWRVATLCHACFHKLSIKAQGVDMWISDRCWLVLDPITPFEELPELKRG